MEEAECPAPVPCVKLDPGNRSLHTVPCCSGQEQQQEQLTEEKVQEAAGVEAQGGKGHAQPGVSRWHWGNSQWQAVSSKFSPHSPGDQ